MKYSQLSILVLLISIVFPVLTTIGILPANAAYYCQCVDYAKQVSGIPGGVAVGNAKDMIYSLPNLGFTRVGAQVGAIVIMQPSFPGADKTYGHVGIIDSIRQSGGLTYLNIRAANQGGSGVSANCNNVSTIGFGTAIDGRSDVSFWMRTNSATNNTPSTNTPSNSSIRTVNFSGTTSSYRSNVRSAPSTTASIAGFINPNTRVSFDAFTYAESVNDIWNNQPDRRWYRIAGTNTWLASAIVYGNAPGSNP